MSDALAVIGERHTLPLLREIAYGYRRFSQLVTLTGAPRTIVATRLRTLEEAGVVRKELYSERPPRHEYFLTAAGTDLIPVMLMLKEWGERHADDDVPKAVFRHSCGIELHPKGVCSACGRELEPGDFDVVGGSHPPMLR